MNGIPFQFSFEDNAVTAVSGNDLSFWEKIPGEEPQPGDWLVQAVVSSTDPEPTSESRVSKEALEKGAKDLMLMRTVLYNHDNFYPIGRVLKTYATDKELKALIRISKTQPKIWEMIQDGTLDKWSIRGKILKLEPTKSNAVPQRVNPPGIIRDWFLQECSLVSVPAQPKAETKGWWIQKNWRSIDMPNEDLLDEDVKKEEETLPEIEPEDFELEFEFDKSGPDPIAKAGIDISKLVRLRTLVATALEAAPQQDTPRASIQKNVLKQALQIIDLILGGTYPYPKPFPYPYPKPKEGKKAEDVEEDEDKKKKEKEKEEDKEKTKSADEGDVKKDGDMDLTKVISETLKPVVEIVQKNSEAIKQLADSIPVRKSGVSKDKDEEEKEIKKSIEELEKLDPVDRLTTIMAFANGEKVQTKEKE